MTTKLKWKVDPAPTGRYRSFQRRGWPTAYYPGPKEKPAAFLSCKDDYEPHRVREGMHAPLKIIVLHHNHPEAGPAWVRFVLNKHPTTLDEAKQLVQQFIDTHPEWHPKEK